MHSIFRWNQSFVYAPVKPSELRSRILEVTVWDYDRFGANEFLGKYNASLSLDIFAYNFDRQSIYHCHTHLGRADHPSSSDHHMR